MLRSWTHLISTFIGCWIHSLLFWLCDTLMLNGLMSIIDKGSSMQTETTQCILTNNVLFKDFCGCCWFFVWGWLFFIWKLPYLLEEFVEFFIQYINMFDVRYWFRYRLRLTRNRRQLLRLLSFIGLSSRKNRCCSSWGSLRPQQLAIKFYIHNVVFDGSWPRMKLLHACLPFFVSIALNLGGK